MDVLITYDISRDENGEKRLRKISKICENYGQRVQMSVFELKLNNTQLQTLKQDLSRIVNKKYDSVRIYHLKGINKIEVIGANNSYNPNDVIII